MGDIVALLRDLGRSYVTRDLLILDSISTRILILDFSVVVGILSKLTRLLCLSLVIILVISGIDDGSKFSATGI